MKAGPKATGACIKGSQGHYPKAKRAHLLSWQLMAINSRLQARRHSQRKSGMRPRVTVQTRVRFLRPSSPNRQPSLVYLFYQGIAGKYAEWEAPKK